MDALHLTPLDFSTSVSYRTIHRTMNSMEVYYAGYDRYGIHLIAEDTHSRP